MFISFSRSINNAEKNKEKEGKEGKITQSCDKHVLDFNNSLAFELPMFVKSLLLSLSDRQSIFSHCKARE